MSYKLIKVYKILQIWAFVKTMNMNFSLDRETALGILIFLLYASKTSKSLVSDL